jgi:hypothetical protein
MAKNKHVDLFKDMIPAVDMGLKELWDAASDEGRKEIKNDLWNLNRYISAVKSNNRELQEHYLLTVNEFYNKNWSDIQKYPKLQWLTLCVCSHESKKTHFHEYIPLKKANSNLESFLLDQYPNMKREDIETLAAITTKEEIREYCEGLGWDKKQIDGFKF